MGSGFSAWYTRDECGVWSSGTRVVRAHVVWYFGRSDNAGDAKAFGIDGELNGYAKSGREAQCFSEWNTRAVGDEMAGSRDDRR